jgi:putative zinc finger protein
MQHLDEGTIHAWLDGALAGDEAADVAKHVAECGDCAAMVAEARGIIVAAGSIISALDGVRSGVIPTPKPVVAGQGSLWRRLRLTPGRAALAATLLVAVASLLTVRRMPRAGAPYLQMAPAAQVATPVVAGSPEKPSPGAARVVSKRDTASPPATSIVRRLPDASLEAKRVMNAVSPKAAQVAGNAPRRMLDSAANSAADRAMPSVAAAPTPPDSIRSAGAAGAAASKTATDARPKTLERRFAPIGQLQQVVTTGMATTAKIRPEVGELEGCFQFREDSTNSAAAAATGFPPRFALLNAGGAVPHVVRAVSAEGRVDSLVPGGNWQRMTPDVLRVQFASARQQQPVTLQLTTGAVTSQAVIGGQSTTLRVAPIECRP